MFVTVDGGTTTTRLNLFDDNVLDTVKLDMGARLGARDKSAFYKAVKDALDTLLSKNGLAQSDVEAIIASGMITSEGGLMSVAHIPAPAGIVELGAAVVRADIKEISHIPFYFVPGVRIFDDFYGNIDVMRGEETELRGLIKLLKVSEKAVFVLPGSHSKIIFTDDDGRINSFFTAMTGEMIASLASGTILEKSIDLKNSNLNDMLYEGYSYASKEGIAKALFKVRIISHFASGTMDDAYSFFMGVILASEIDAIARSDAREVYIGGRKQIKDAEALLIKRFTDKSVVVIPDEIVDIATSVGMVEIYNFRKSTV